MNKALFLIPLFHVLFSGICYSQYDTIKADASVSMMLEKDINATEVKKGDTLLAFKVTDDVFINNSKYQNFRVIEKGAQVLTVVESSVKPGKLKPNIGGKVYDDPDWQYRPAYTDLKTGGELVIKIISVQAIDGSYLPFNECVMQKMGGLFGGYSSYKVQATLVAGSRKSCSTKPDSIILVKKTD